MDDVINAHREVVYKLRKRVLEVAENNRESVEWFISKLSENTNFDAEKFWKPHEEKLGVETWCRVVSDLSRPVIDFLWMEHLVDMDQLREGIGLRGYAQRDPIVEYKREGHDRFQVLIGKIYGGISDRLEKLSVDAQVGPAMPKGELPKNLNYQRGTFESGVADESKAIKVAPVKSNAVKVGRNDPCPCGSGKKYKNCGLINAPGHRA